jgi:small subunit ribosomal protein S2
MPKKKEEGIIEKIEESVEKAEEVVEEIIENAEEILEGKEKKTKKQSKKKKNTEELTGKELEKEAEAESIEKSIEEKKKAILKKAEKLREKVEGATTEELKEQVKEKKKEATLLPLDDYVKSGIYLGTKVVTPDMKPFVYRRRADGLAIFNTDLIDEKLKEGIEFIKNFEAKEIIIICKRQAGWKAVKMFSEITGLRAFTKKYPAGILTNTKLPNFFENELTIVFDSWLDKNALEDTRKVGKKILMICDTNNFSKGADCVVIGNNKSAKSLGLILYLLAKGYCEKREIEANIPKLEDWMIEEED